LDEATGNNNEVAPSVKHVVQRLSLELKEAVPDSGTTFHISGLAQNLVENVLRAEYRARENDIGERSRKKEFGDRFDLERELRQVRQEEERGVLTPFVRQLLGMLSIESLFSDAVNSPEFAGLVGAAYGNATSAELDQSIDEVRKAFVPRKENERRALADGAPALMYCYTSSAAIEKTMLERIASVNEYATIAVISPTEHDAVKWHGRLHRELATGRRPASLSRREDLTGRFDIHFTHVYETKGLEFDVVIVPDLGAFELESEIGRNQAYVAISRPKHALFLGCCASQCRSKEISVLIDHRLLRIIEIK
jgi:hypothetical protein